MIESRKSESPAGIGLRTEHTKSTYAGILEPQAMDRKEFDNLRDRFARRRYVLQRVYRADDGRVTYHVTRNTQTRIYSHPHDLAGFLAVVEGSV